MTLQTMQSPLRRWDAMVLLAREIGAKHFVEVGCKEGRTTAHVLAECPDIRVTAIDPWSAVPNASESYESWDFGKIEATFWKNVGENRDRVNMLRALSSDAAGRVEGADLVFIDAAHDYENVKADIERWWGKVPEGGVIAGHDYNHKWPGVMRAVADSFPLLAVGVMPDSVWMVRK